MSYGYSSGILMKEKARKRHIGHKARLHSTSEDALKPHQRRVKLRNTVYTSKAGLKEKQRLGTFFQ